MSLAFLCAVAIAVDGDTLRCSLVDGPQAPGGGPPAALAPPQERRRAGALAALRADLAEVNGRVRLARIDAPERGEAGFGEAKRALAEMIAGREVRCRLVDADPRIAGFQRTDRYDRPVARCRAGGVDLGEALVAAGHAVRWGD